MVKLTSIFWVFLVINKTKCLVPGLFYWKPRMALHLVNTETSTVGTQMVPSMDSITNGTMVLIDAYTVGITTLVIAECFSKNWFNKFPQFNPMKPIIYNDAYRWALRYLSLLPDHFSGKGKTLADTHKVWQRRFHFMNEFVPNWMTYLFPYISQDEWASYMKDTKKFRIVAEPTFAKHYRYPNKMFNDFRSEEDLSDFDSLS